MTSKPYHHGNLEETLIEAGIVLLDEEGPENFSLRKVAAACGVSHAAPYKHFENKEALIEAMWQHIAVKFSAAMENALAEHAGSPQRMPALGKAYLRFFLENPQYFRLLVTQPTAAMDLSNMDVVSQFHPFEVFKNAARDFLDSVHIPVVRQAQDIARMWAKVMGVTTLAVMPSVHYDGDWYVLLENLLDERRR